MQFNELQPACRLTGDMPRLFKKFDSDGNGELGMDEFVETFLKMP